jgi:hypothetical protein
MINSGQIRPNAYGYMLATRPDSTESVMLLAERQEPARSRRILLSSSAEISPRA